MKPSNSSKDEREIYIGFRKEETLKVRPSIVHKVSDEWEREDVDPNLLFTITSKEGDMLYSKEIHDWKDIDIDISTFPERFIVGLEKQVVDEYETSVEVGLFSSKYKYE